MKAEDVIELANYAQTLREQRDELLAALKVAETYFTDRADAEYDTRNEEISILVEIKNAIAKAKQS